MDQSNDFNTQDIVGLGKMMHESDVERKRIVFDPEMEAKLMEVIKIVEEKKGWPATSLELMQYVMKDMDKYPPSPVLTFRALFKNDKVFTDTTGSYFSLQKWNEDFDNMTGRINKKYGQYGYI